MHLDEWNTFVAKILRLFGEYPPATRGSVHADTKNRTIEFDVNLDTGAGTAMGEVAGCAVQLGASIEWTKTMPNGLNLTIWFPDEEATNATR